MKHLFFISCIIGLSLQGLLAQDEIVLTARPTSLGYCASKEGECSGELLSIAGNDLSGYLLKIKYQKNLALNVELYNNGKLMESIHSNGFNTVKITKKVFHISCHFFEFNCLFHTKTVNEHKHPMHIDVARKIKKGKIFFHYPEEERIYVYAFDLL